MNTSTAQTQGLKPEIVEGCCRNEPNKSRSHLYKYVDGELYPMCGYGWNQSGGESFSILRGWRSERGTCKLCEKNVKAGKTPVMDGFPHTTKWL
jgi:hypothetical protein